MKKVYGPYTRPDGRKHVIHYDGVSRRTQSYPRYLMELHLGRELKSTEHVDHINNDFTDNRVENLQLLTVAENNRKSAKPKKIIIVNCGNCLSQFEIEYRQYKNNQLKLGKAGPYCSKRCAGQVHN